MYKIYYKSRISSKKLDSIYDRSNTVYERSIFRKLIHEQLSTYEQ